MRFLVALLAALSLQAPAYAQDVVARQKAAQAQASADAAQATANAAQSAAATAQVTANTANSAAGTAQTTANTALSTANAAVTPSQLTSGLATKADATPTGIANAGGAVATTVSMTNRVNRVANIFRAAKLSNPWDNPVVTSAPTIAQSATHDSALTQNIPAVVGGVPNTGKFTFAGGSPYVISTFLVFPSISEAPATGNLNGFGGGTAGDMLSQVSWAVEGECWCAKVEFEIGSAASAAGYKIQINGAYVSKTATAIVANQKFLSVDFGSLGWHRIRLESQSILTGIWVAPTAEWRATDLSDVLRMVWVGNSYFRDGAGVNSSVDHTGILPFAACSMLGVRDCRSAGIGSSGYLQTASRSTYRGRVSYVSTYDPNPDVIVISDPANDYANGQTTAAITAEALLTWQAYRAANPNAVIVVTGMQPRISGPGASEIAVETALKAQFDVWADPYSVWVPISTDPVPWVTTANKSLLIAPDNVHLLTPPTAGNAAAGAADAQIGRRMADGIRSALDTLRRQISWNDVTVPANDNTPIYYPKAA